MSEKRLRRVGTSKNERERKRQRILDASMSSFCDLGYSGATIIEISRRAGIADGGLYLYFKNKDALWRELFETRLKMLSQKLDHDLTDHPDPEKKVETFVRFHLNQAAHSPKLLLFLLSCTPHTGGLHTFYQAQMIVYWNRLVPYVEAALKRLKKPPSVAAESAAMVCAYSLRSVCQALVEQELILDVRAINEVGDRLIQLAMYHPAPAR